ncbi:MAG: Arginase, partial [uncultured Rubrobacteraceae bacterium]
GYLRGPDGPRPGPSWGGHGAERHPLRAHGGRHR